MWTAIIPIIACATVGQDGNASDSDMIPSIEIIKSSVPEHPVYLFVLPNQQFYALASKCDNTIWQEHYRSRFLQSMRLNCSDSVANWVSFAFYIDYHS